MGILVKFISFILLHRILHFSSIVISIIVVVRFYEGVVELSLYSALKRDPQGLALHFYKNGEPRGDVQGEEAFLAR